MCVLFSVLLFPEAFLIIRIERDINTNIYIGLHVKYQIILVGL